MQYMLLIYGDEREWTTMSEDDAKKMYAAYGAYTQELIDSGAMRGGSELAPISSATTVRVRGGKVQTTDGPFAETKEQLGGYYIIEVPTLDDAVRWASKIPSAAWGSVEVRPMVEDPAD